MRDSEEDVKNEIIRLLESLGIELSILSANLLQRSAHDYLQFGVARRLSIIRVNLLSIFEIAYPGRQQPLDLLGESAALSMHLHSFFYHCYGALDNAAWCVAYEKGFLEPRCDWKKHKHKIGFYEEKYSNWLKEKYPVMWAVLQEQKMVHKDMKEIRDAIAHRIPLYVPAAITPAQREEQIRLYGLAKQVGPHDSKYYSLWEQADTMGYFIPWFYVEGDPDPKYNLKLYPLKVTGHLLTILTGVKAELAKGSIP